MAPSEQVPSSANACSAWRQQGPWQGGAGITKTGVPWLWLGFLPAGITLHCSLCPCDLQPRPPDGQSWPLGARSSVGLSNTLAQPQAWVWLCRLYQQSPAPSTSAFCSFSAASAPLQGNPKVYNTGKVPLHSSLLLSATEMCCNGDDFKGI